METRAADLSRRPPGLRRRSAEERRLHPRWPWWTPAFVTVVILLFPFFLVRASGAVIGIGVIVLVARRPEPALAALVVLVPFHAQIFAGLYRLGVPGDVVRALGQWKEIAILGVFAAGARRAFREGHRVDRLDVVGLLYVGLGLGYLFFPSFIVRDDLGATLDFTTRLLGWRTDVLYVALFLACRHLRLAPDAVARLVRIFLSTATVIAAIAVFEFVFPSLWNSFMIERLQLHRYKLDVLNINPATDRYLYDVRVYTSVGGRQVLRVGSVMLLYWALGFYMVGASAILADRVVRGVATTRQYAALALTAGAVVLTQTRSAILGLVVVLALTLLRRSGRSQRAADSRVRFSIILGALVAFAIPAALAMGLVDRFQGGDDYSSNESHRNSFERSYDTFVESPLGRGLATSAGAGQRADVTGAEVTETQYLQIGTQLGVVGLVLWVAFVIGAIVALGRATARAPAGLDTGLATATRTALIGLFAAGFFLQIYIEFSVAWSLWMLAGLALGMVESAGRGTSRGATGQAAAPVPAR